MQNIYQNEKEENRNNSYQNEFQKLSNVKIAVTQKQYTFGIVNNARNFDFVLTDPEIPVACLVS